MNSFKRTCACTVVFSVPDPAAGHCQLTPPLEHSQASLAQSLVVTLFLLALGVHKALFVPLKSMFPQSCGSSVIKSHWPPKSNSLRVFSHFAGYPGWESVLCPRTFLTVQEFLWYNCSAVCRSSAQQLYGGANDDLLQEGLCHTLHD